MTASSSRLAIVVRGGWEGHVPVEATDMFIPHLRAGGFEVRVFDSPAPYADGALMATVDLVVQCMTLGSIGDEEIAGLRAAVAAGTGLAGWHGGMVDSYRASSDYLQLVGAQFASHPAASCHHTVRHRAGCGRPSDLPGLDALRAGHRAVLGAHDDYLDVLATTTQRVLPGEG